MAVAGAGTGAGSGPGVGVGVNFFWYFHIFLYLFYLSRFFSDGMILPNGNNQPLRRNRELDAEHHGVLFTVFPAKMDT